MIVNIVSIQKTSIEDYKNAILVKVNPTVPSPFGYGSVPDISKTIYLVYPNTEDNYNFLEKAKQNSDEYFEFSEMSFSEKYITNIGRAYVHKEFFRNDDISSEAGDSVDLGLSVLWADRNVGAKDVSDFGSLFGYGDISGKIKSSDINDYAQGSILNTDRDIAHARWGKGWHMPTKADCRELLNKCNWRHVQTNSGNVGYLVTGPNGNQIFLPSAGIRMGNEILRQNDWGTYWVGDYGELIFDRNNRDVNEWPNTYYGHSVRPVKDMESRHPIYKDYVSVNRDYILSTINLYDDIRAKFVSAYLHGNKQAIQHVMMIHEFTCPLFYAWEHFGYGKMNELWKEDLAIETYNKFKSKNVLEESRKTLIIITNGIFPFSSFDNDGKIYEATKNILKALIRALEK